MGLPKTVGFFIMLFYGGIFSVDPTKHFGLSFAYNAPKVWNDFSLHSFRKKLQNYLFETAYPS